MALQDKVANRYARAILDTLTDKSKSNAVVAELREFAEAVEQNRELSLALGTPMFSHEIRTSIISDICEKMKVSPESRKALMTISAMNRITSLRAIAHRLNTLLLEASGVVPLQVQSASELGAEERKSVETRFSKLLGKPVSAHYELSSGLIGGIRVTASGKTYDGSLSGWLNHFEEQLVGGSI